MKIIDYCILNSTTISGLSYIVNLFIKKGWQPLGGIYGNPSYYFQAMIVYEDF